MPEVPPHLIWIWRCYQRLSADRPWHGGGLGPAIPGAIPWVCVAKWIEFHNYNDAEAQMLDHCVREMDTVYIQHYHEKTNRHAKASPTPS